MTSIATHRLSPPGKYHAAARTEHYDLSIDVPYSLIEADAVFHNVSLEAVIRRYLAAKLREVGDAR
jgi:hypothetical protein